MNVLHVGCGLKMSTYQLIINKTITTLKLFLWNSVMATLLDEFLVGFFLAIDEKIFCCWFFLA